ncbi:restriction endonuclease subunit S [Paenibacillus sp. FSL H7-0756]|uniref:restriction endonuclease subunit S n=1 Tax=Paenibacillus sp. FSL H7-0756 TaxID=2954738 RepID=UPI0030F63D3A
MNRVKFADVVIRANTKEDKDNTEKEFYVGGEHILSSEVLIKDRGVIAGSTIGPMFYFGFKAGQVLFVTRNPHLKKAGMVTFDGICSEKTFVLESKDENVLLQRYLPFVLQSNDFWSYAEANKSGSVNYFINWSTLAKYEFELPSITVQRELSDLLWAIENTKQAYRKLLQKTDELVKSQFIEMFGDPVGNERRWEQCTIEEVCSRIMGGGTPSKSISQYYTGEIPWVTPKDMKTVLIEDSIDHITEEAVNNSPAKLIPAHSVLMVIRSGILKHDLPLAINTVPVTVNQDMKAFIVGERITPEFLLHTFKAHKADLLSNVRAVTADNIEFGIIRNLKINLPPIDLQKRFDEFVRLSDKSKFELEQSLKDLDFTYRRIISENLG